MRRRSESGVDHHRHVCLVDYYSEHLARCQSLVGADRRSERHHCRRAHVFQPFAEHRVGLDVRQHPEAEFGEFFGGLQRFYRVGEQIFRVGVDFELYEVCAEAVARQLSRQHRLVGVAHARCVGQELHVFAVYVFEHVVRSGVARVEAFHRHGNHFRARLQDSVEHSIV